MILSLGQNWGVKSKTDESNVRNSVDSSKHILTLLAVRLAVHLPI